MSERDWTLFFYFPRCPVCGQWCKLHWLLLDTPSFDWNTRRSHGHKMFKMAPTKQQNFWKRYNHFRTPYIVLYLILTQYCTVWGWVNTDRTLRDESQKSTKRSPDPCVCLAVGLVRRLYNQQTGRINYCHIFLLLNYRLGNCRAGN